MGLSVGVNGNLVLGSGHDPQGCCCCDVCCFKFCGDEYLEATGFNGDPTIFGIAGDYSYYLQSSTISIGNQPLTGDEPGYCGVEFNFLATIEDGLTGARCEDVPGRMYLCIGDHSSDPDIPDCDCLCHWHITVDGCEQECPAEAECIWNYDGVEWQKTTDTCGDCTCVHPDPDEVGGFEEGEHISECIGVSVGPKSFIGGDSCLAAECDAPICGKCGDFDNAGLNITDPDGSVRCCCAAILHAANQQDEGEV